MIEFAQIKRRNNRVYVARIVELSPRDIFRLLLGREIEIDVSPADDAVCIRLSPNYEAFNMGASPEL